MLFRGEVEGDRAEMAVEEICEEIAARADMKARKGKGCFMMRI